MDLGADLRKARIARQRSIEDISRSTKISSSVLRAIENDDFGKVPGGLFTRGYLRAYARDVGLEPEEMVRRYRAAYEAPEPPQDIERAASPPAWSPSKLTDPEDEAARTRRGQIVELGVILVVVAACFAFLRQPQPSSPSAPPTAEAPAAAPATLDVPVATSGRNAAPQSELKVDLHPQGPCWVEATADGERVVAKLMNAGDRQAITVRENLTLRIGDPAAFAFSINGVPGRPFGRAGQPETVQINRRNYETFLQPRP
jgi:hypothetical protein